MPSLNERAHELCNAMAAEAEKLGIAIGRLACGTRIIDCGVKALGGIEAGRRLAEVCLSGLGRVSVDPMPIAGAPYPTVSISTDAPVAACMASQYAGWEIKGEKFFGMGSGPMRAAACREELFQEIGNCERPEVCVGVLETSKLPPEPVCIEIAAKCGIGPERLTLLAARTSSLAGTLQIVARSVETALHKLHVLGFDLGRVVRGLGTAPLPPQAGDDWTAIGWTNDAILYGAVVEITVTGDDQSLQAFGPRVPSRASADYGRPFAEIFSRYNNDFYRIDPLLFSPAVVGFRNADTGSSFCFGQCELQILEESFGKK